MAPFKSTQSFSVGTFLRTFRNRDAVGPAALNSPERTNRIPALEEYVYIGQTETTVVVADNTKFITFAGIAEGGSGGSTGGRGGGGGASNLTGYTIPVGFYGGATLYVGVGDGGPTYVRTGSHSGTILFELNRGTNGGAGGAANPTYNSVAGGDGGPSAGRYQDGIAGSPVTNSGAGGGGGGGYGDQTPATPGGSGAPGGSVTMTGPFIEPNGGGPAPAWTFGPSTSGGGTGQSAPNSGAGGGNSGPNGGSGGGGGAGVIFNGFSYGGGGGGGGGNNNGNTYNGGAGSSGFLIIQFE